MEWVTDKLPPIDPAKAKEVEIEEKDERNITIANMAKARTYERMSVLFAFALCLLGVLGYLPHVSFFTFLGVFLISQLYFIYQLWMLHKTM